MFKNRMNVPLKRFLVSRDELIHLFIHTFLYKLTLQTRVCVCVCTQLCLTLRPHGLYVAIAHQAPLSIGFSKQEYWSGLPFPAPEDLTHPVTELTPLVTPALADGLFTVSATK